MESSPLYKFMVISSLVTHIRSKSFVTTSHSCTSGHGKEACLTDFSNTKWSLLSSLISKSFGLLEKTSPFLICWVEMFPWRTCTVTNWLIKKFPRMSGFSIEADMKFKISLTTTGLLMMEMMIFIPLFALIWVKQEHFTLKLMALKWFVYFLNRSQQNLSLFFLIPSEKAKTLTIDENGKLYQWL